MKIEKGPFAGTDIPENEITYLLSNNGEDLPFWPTHNRTPIFLDKYRPENGWQVVVENHPGPFNLPDTRKPDYTSEILVQPTQLFVAKLIKEGTTYAQASMLAIIDGPSAWEKGETTARGRLYETQGLYGFLPRNQNGHMPMARDNAEAVPQVAPKAASTIPLNVAPIAATSSTRAAIQEEANGQSEAPVEAPSKEQTTGNADQPTDGSDKATSSPVTVEAQPKTEAVVLPAPRRNADRGSRSNIARGVNDNLRDQIIFLAEAQGKTIPEIKDNKEAKAFYKELLQAGEQAAGTAS